MLLEVNGISVVDKHTSFVHYLLRRIPRTKKVTITAMAPIQDVTTSTVLRAPLSSSAIKCASLYKICFPSAQSNYDDDMKSPRDLQRKDSGCDSQTSHVSASSHKENANGKGGFVNKQANFVHNLLRWIPQEEKVTIVAMAPLQDISPTRLGIGIYMEVDGIIT